MSEVVARPAGWDCHVHVFDAGAPVAAGHYQPADRPLSQIETEAARHGVQHLVLVQPSVHGGDNALLLRSLQQQPGRHRGVVVLDGPVDDATLDAWHATGVRGVRLNLVSPVGERGVDLTRRFRELTPHLNARDWHLQWYAAPEHLALIAHLHANSGVVAVLDHLAGLHARLADDDAAWTALQALADGGAWVKLSGWYRLQAGAPYDALFDRIRRVAGCFGERLVWGSDWPHTSFAPDRMPAYASTWAPVVQALGAARAHRLRDGAHRLYGP